MTDGFTVLSTLIAVAVIIFLSAIASEYRAWSMCNELRLRIGVEAYQAAVTAEICK